MSTGPYPQVESMMRHALERERFALETEAGRGAQLKEELAEVMRTCDAKRERIAEMERWLEQFGSR